MGVTCDVTEANVMLYVPPPAGSTRLEVSFLGINRPDGRLWVSNFVTLLGTKQDPAYDTKWNLDDGIAERYQRAMLAIDSRFESVSQQYTSKFVPLGTITPRQVLRVLDAVRKLLAEIRQAMNERQA